MRSLPASVSETVFLLLVEFEVALDERGDQLVDRDIEIGAIFNGPRDDERRAGLVDQDRVDLVDDREDVIALDHLRPAHLHVVAKIVETEFVVGAVRDIAGVGGAALVVVHVVEDDADGQAQESVDLSHPVRVAAGEIVVDGDDMHALAVQGVEINGERRHESLALAGFHLGDLALVQRHAADKLHIEVSLAKRTLGSLTHGCECRHQQLVEGPSISNLATETPRCARAIRRPSAPRPRTREH